MSLSVKELLSIGKKRLEQSGIEDALLDSKLLYCHMMNLTTSQLILEYQKVLQDTLCDEYFNLLDDRCSGVPLQYITGVQEFMGLEFIVNENVLIPRQDTETLVEDAIEVINNNSIRGEMLIERTKRSKDVLDLCCGSGAIGISLTINCPNIKMTCSDLSTFAIKTAKENADKLCGNKGISFVVGDLLTPFIGKFKNKKFDLIISNPPYIKSSVIPTLQREVREHEPRMALDGGNDGLEFYKRIIEQAPGCLKRDGVLMLEIGHDQKNILTQMINDSEKFEKVYSFKDLAKRDRIIVAKVSGKKKQ